MSDVQVLDIICKKCGWYNFSPYCPRCTIENILSDIPVSPGTKEALTNLVQEWSKPKPKINPDPILTKYELMLHHSPDGERNFYVYRNIDDDTYWFYGYARASGQLVAFYTHECKSHRDMDDEWDVMVDALNKTEWLEDEDVQDGWTSYAHFDEMRPNRE